MVERHDRVPAGGQLADQAGVERDRDGEAAREQQHAAHVPARGRVEHCVGVDVEKTGRHSNALLDGGLDGRGEVGGRRSLAVPGRIPDANRDRSRPAGPRLRPGGVKHES
jgi:hypothetical protein